MLIKIIREMSSVTRKIYKMYVLSNIPSLAEAIKKYSMPGLELQNIDILDIKEITPDWTINIKDAEIILADNPIIANIMHSLPKIKWIQSTWAGVELIVNSADKSKPKPSYLITRHSGSLFCNQIAEYILLAILNSERNSYELWINQRNKKWNPELYVKKPFRNLSQLTIGILGVGNMGLATAKYLKNFDATVIGLARNKRSGGAKEYASFDSITTDLSELLSACDYICNLLPATSSTIGLLNGCVLNQCQKKPVFINAGRGNIIKEDDLINALNKQWISGAVLDVFETEPLPTTSPLWDMPQVVITPHTAAISKADEIADSFVENYKLFVAGKSLLNVVDLEQGY